MTAGTFATRWNRLSGEWKTFAWMVGVFLLAYYLPLSNPKVTAAIQEAFRLLQWYARNHTLACVVPALFIAGAVITFLSQASVMRYLGPNSNKLTAYSVASVSGGILAVCSCSVLPVFAGIYRLGAGLGPAIAFLYSGPAINVLAIVLTARILGLELGIARAFGAILFSVVIGLAMHLIYRKEEQAKADAAAAMPEPDVQRPLWQTVLYFATMIGILVFANWGKPADEGGLWDGVWAWKWPITAAFGVAFGVVLVKWLGVAGWKVLAVGLPTAALALGFPHEPMLAFAVGAVGLSVITSTSEGEASDWFSATWTFAKQILPLLFIGVLVAGLLLGRPGNEGLIPNAWVTRLVGGNSLWANFFASVVGAFMYFATLTEVPILQGLIGSGMGKGPALALLLAGPALSLPNMLVLRSIMGAGKTVVYVTLVIVMAAVTGMIYGALF